MVAVWEREYSNVQNSLSPPAIPQPMILASSQRAGTSWMDIDYQVTDADSATVSTAVLAFKNGGTTLNDAVVMSTFMEGTSANMGANQATNTSHHLTWAMASDWTVDYAQVQVEALAKDSRNLLGVHWITVPASGANPAVQVSAAPIADAKLLDLWFWFIASQQAGVSFSNGVVKGTSGLYAGQTLATGTVSTTAGRLFCYDQLGVRPITSPEIAQAQGGNYGFSSVDGNSVVKVASNAGSYVQVNGNYSNSQTASTSGAQSLAQGESSNSLLFIKSDGSLWGMFSNNYGQLNDGTTTDRNVPVLVATGVSQAATGLGFTLFVKAADGSLWGVGNNNYGQLGIGSTITQRSPVQIATGGVLQVAAGNGFSLFVKTDGSLWAMGNNGYGQLGDNSTTQRIGAVPILPAGSGVTQVAAGGNHSLFIRNGALWAMGYNGYGQLGNGNNNQQSAPVLITTNGNVTQVSAGDNHSLYVRADGTLWAVGYNGWGQLGDGTTNNRNAPWQVATGVTQASAGTSYSVFIKTDKTLSAMGYNNYGQLGDGTTTSHPMPLQVGVDASAVSAYATFSAVLIKP